MSLILYAFIFMVLAIPTIVGLTILRTVANNSTTIIPNKLQYLLAPFIGASVIPFYCFFCCVFMVLSIKKLFKTITRNTVLMVASQVYIISSYISDSKDTRDAILKNWSANIILDNHADAVMMLDMDPIFVRNPLTLASHEGYKVSTYHPFMVKEDVPPETIY